MTTTDYPAQEAICKALAHDADIFAKSVIAAHATIPDGPFNKFLSDFGATVSLLKMQAQDQLRALKEEQTFAEQFAK